MIEKLLKMLASGRDDPMLRFGLGSALFKENRFDEAIEHLKACIAQDANYSAAYKLLGRSLMAQGRLDEAGRVFEQGLQVARAQGDKQAEKEITVFQKKMAKH